MSLVKQQNRPLVFKEARGVVKMNFLYYMPTKVLVGKNCVKENSNELSKWGENPIIVTGKTSGQKSGALKDVIEVLKVNGQEHHIFDKVINNPTLENVAEGGRFAKDNASDYVIAIGGGSPLDAAKAIAVLAANDNMQPEELYLGKFANKPLPIVAIPTTAGTGSEVTPYSILTYNEIQNKKSFASEEIFPRVAFLDASYTMMLPREVAIHTAVDALSHAIEGYVCVKANEMTDITSIEVFRLFKECYGALDKGSLDFEAREKLLYMAMLAGIVIAHTGTTIVHSMGYPLTFFRDIPHGKANGLLLSQFLKFNYEAAKDKIDNILKIMNTSSIGDFTPFINKLIPSDEEFTVEELNNFAKIAIEAKNVGNNIRRVSLEQELDIYTKSLM